MALQHILGDLECLVSQASAVDEGDDRHVWVAADFLDERLLAL